jgi:hypothetical protein
MLAVVAGFVPAAVAASPSFRLAEHQVLAAMALLFIGAILAADQPCSSPQALLVSTGRRRLG